MLFIIEVSKDLNLGGFINEVVKLVVGYCGNSNGNLFNCDGEVLFVNLVVVGLFVVNE